MYYNIKSELLPCLSLSHLQVIWMSDKKRSILLNAIRGQVYQLLYCRKCDSMASLDIRNTRHRITNKHKALMYNKGSSFFNTFHNIWYCENGLQGSESNQEIDITILNFFDDDSEFINENVGCGGSQELMEILSKQIFQSFSTNRPRPTGGSRISFFVGHQTIISFCLKSTLL